MYTGFSTNILKHYLEKTFSRISLDKDIEAFLNAIILGNKNLMRSTEKDIYRNSGTMHLFAVSGIHVGVGIITATSFSGSASGLTAVPSAQLSGALPALDGSALTNLNIPAGFTELDAALFN